MKDFSIVIAHRGDPMGLWSTIHSCESELAGSDYDYEYCLCLNGEGERRRTEKIGTRILTPDVERVLHFLEKSGRGGKQTVLQRSVSPPTARQIATKNAKGRYLFMLDNHCLVGKNYFSRALESFERYEMDLLHSTTKFFTTEISYEYALTLKSNFWGYSRENPRHESEPYEIAAGGHGGFAVRSSVWKTLGGYWDGFVGYGGEELSVDLQLWMMGYTVGLDPNMIHYHWAGKRPYQRHFTADYYRNMMMSAHLVGGEKWLYTVYQSFAKNFPKVRDYPMHDLLLEAYYKSNPQAKRIADRSVRTLDEQMEFFVQNGISH
jgi:hypothetical protein